MTRLGREVSPKGAWVLLLCAVAPGAAHAQTTLTAQEEQFVNYAFATQLGSGVYGVEGRTVQVYRLPFSWAIRREGQGRPGVRLNFPASIGFFDFKETDVVDTGLPSSLDTASFVPGVEIRVMARKNWILAPFVDFGIAVDRSSEASAYVYSMGVRSVADFTAGRFALALGNKATYGRVNPRESRPADDFVSFETSLEARHGMGFWIRGREADYGLYAAQYLYFSDTRFPLPHDTTNRPNDQYEIGVTFGTTEPATLGKIRLPRLGFGYRFAEGVSAFRFVIGTPTLSLER